jgi:hypothetical protein
MGMMHNTHRGTVVKRLGPKPCRARPVSEVLPSGCWKGERCVILGGGPSLRGFDFSVLDGIMQNQYFKGRESLLTHIYLA